MGRTARVSRKDVLDAARETFVEQGYEGARLSDIAARLGVSAAALLTPVMLATRSHCRPLDVAAPKCKSPPVVADRDQQKSRRTASGITRWPVKDLHGD